MKYSFLAQYEKTWPIDSMCRVLGVQRNGYYHYRQRGRDRVNDGAQQTSLQVVKDIAAAKDRCYGSPTPAGSIE